MRRVAAPPDRLTVTNCGGDATRIAVRGTDASGAGATWTLTDASSGGPIDSRCELGPNLFRATVTLWLGTGVGTPLTTQDTPLQGATEPFTLAAAASQEFSPEIELPCEDSDGLGQPMSMDITLTAVGP